MKSNTNDTSYADYQFYDWLASSIRMYPKSKVITIYPQVIKIIQVEGDTPEEVFDKYIYMIHDDVIKQIIIEGDKTTND
jgi:hypothetical protein